MALDRGIIDTAVRITSVGDLRGTGFLMTVPSETHEDVRWGYVVTAHHVIRNQIELAVRAPNPLAGQRNPVTITAPLSGQYNDIVVQGDDAAVPSLRTERAVEPTSDVGRLRAGVESDAVTQRRSAC